jgi:DNA-binding HxlR family transcriptional regulator
MRSYEQHCGLAKALDAVGDRWTLLIVRELLIRERCRYTDLQKGLPGIATNLLAERLRELEAAGLVEREEAPPPVAATLFGLTARGMALEPAILALGAWGAPMLARGSRGVAAQAHWLVLPFKLFLRDREPARRDASVEVRAGGEAIAIRVSRGKVDVRLGALPDPDLTVTGKPDMLLGLFSGKLDRAAAKAAGARLKGDEAVLDRILPRA